MVFGFLRRRRRRALRAQPFPDAWRRYVEENVSAFQRLRRQEQDELLGHAQVLLAEKHWEGCGGLVLTDEIRVTIAAQAALLLLHRDEDYFPTVVSVLVYPAALSERKERPAAGGVWEEHESDFVGRAMGNLNAIVLAWDSVREGAANPDDGHNVVLHEFAHELDFQDGTFNGAPWLPTAAAYRAWARALAPAFEQHRAAVDAGERTAIDSYGAKDPAEFFAVLTETFFERPTVLREAQPDVYEQLRSFYQQDPARDAV